MRNLVKLITKDLKLLIRSRSSALIIILAPLLVILLLGVAFDNANVFGITIGAYSEAYSADVENVLTKLSEKELHVVKYESEQSCVDDIKTGNINTCVVFPPNLNFNTNEQKQVVFHVDQSKINLVWMILDTVNERFGTSAREVSKNLITVLINKLEASKNEIQGKKDTISALKLKTQDAESGVSGIKTELDGLDFTYNENDTFPINDVNAKLTGIEQNLTSYLDEAHKKVSSANTDLNGTSAGTKLDAAIEQIEAAQEVIEGASDPSFIKLKESLEKLRLSIETAKATLTQASQIKETAGPKLTTVQSQLSDGLVQLGDLDASFDQIIADIQSIQVTNPEAIAQPFTTEIKPVAAPTTYLNYLFPSLIILVVMFISMLLSTTLVMMEKHSPAYFRNFISPTRNITFIMGTFLTNMFLVGIQIGIILLIAAYAFSAQISSNLPMIVLILMLTATLFTLWGMGIGYIFTSEETGTLATITSGSVFLFLSSVIIPLESMPPLIRQIAAFNPFVVCERVLREVLLYNPEIKVIQTDLYIIIGYSIAFFLFIVAFHEFLNKHFMQKITYSYHKRQREHKGDKKSGKETPKAEKKREPAQKVGFGMSIKQKEQPKPKPEYSRKLSLSLSDQFKRKR